MLLLAFDEKEKIEVKTWSSGIVSFDKLAICASVGTASSATRGGPYERG